MSSLVIPVLHGATGTTPDEIDTLRTAEAVRDALLRLGFRSGLVSLGQAGSPLEALLAQRPDLVFNLVEAIDGQGAPAAAFPGVLAQPGLRFTGCGPEASLACLSKPEQKGRMARAGLPTPKWSMSGERLSMAARVIVKSTTEHASLGIDQASVVPGSRAVEAVRERSQRHGNPFFAELYVEGREFALSLLEIGGMAHVLPPAEILFKGFPKGRAKIVDYEAKWVEESHAYTHTPRRFDFPPSDAVLLTELERLARECWQLFGLAGYARADFRVDHSGRPWILEINTNPCIAPDAGFVATAARAGLGFDELVGRIVAAALAQPQKAA